MQLMEKNFIVSLTEADIETITTALQNAYTSLNVDEQPCMTDRKAAFRSLRNAFGTLIGHTFLGKDA